MCVRYVNCIKNTYEIGGSWIVNVCKEISERDQLVEADTYPYGGLQRLTARAAVGDVGSEIV
jgi:hypothetical protein